jgi:flagellar biosynthesis/type III secretory pathway ATPase
MVDVTTVEHRSWAGKIRELLAAYRDAEDLINIGAYVRGSNPRIDEAIAKISAIQEFLRQGIYDKVSFSRTVELLHGALA